MSALTSEQAITALEHSSKPTIELLVDAAAIVDFSTSEQSHKTHPEHASSLKLDSARFREQWILRWMIKRLTQAVDTTQTLNEHRKKLLSDQRTWNLLNHLLLSIPRHFSRAILLERNFCHTFGECLAVTNSLEDSELPVLGERVSPTDDHDQIGDRPSKRRKVSRDQSVSEQRQISSKSLLLLSLLRVGGQIAQSLLVTVGANVTHRRCVSSNWTNGVDEAAMFIARLVAAASSVTADVSGDAHSNDGTLADLANIVDNWIDLWQASAMAARNQRKQDASVAFVNHALVAVLDFLGNRTDDSMKKAYQALERQIATACVLPMRSAFQKHFEGMWISWEQVSQAEMVQRVVESLISGLGLAAAGFHSSKGEDRAAILLGIASRIIPPSDMVRRRADRPWIEALFLCLCTLLSASHQDKKASPSPDISSRISSINAKPALHVIASDVCLDALQMTENEPSVHFWHFFVQQALSGSKELPSRTLAKIVGLNASVFVPKHDDPTPWLLDTLCTVLVDNQIPNNQFLESTLADIIVPIFEEFGKKRRLDLLVEFWQTKLVNTFHSRTNTTAEDAFNILWDHPDLIKLFSAVCQRYAPPSLCINYLKMAVEDITSLTDIVGPTHTLFARVTILVSMLRALGGVPSIQQIISEQAKPICHLVCKALYRPTDYQGHRWRLWNILELFVHLSPETLHWDYLLEVKLPWTHASYADFEDPTLQTVQSKSECMELVQSFSCILTLYEDKETDGQTMLSALLRNFNELLQVCCQSSKTSLNISRSWNGLVGTMDSAHKVFSACLARLARSSASWSLPQIIPIDLLTNLATLTSCQNSMGHSDLAVAAEEALTKTTMSTKMDLRETYLSSWSRGEAMDYVPTLLHTVVQESVSKDQTQKLFETVCEVAEKTDSDSHETFVEYLSLIEEALSNYPKLAVKVLSLTPYIGLLKRDASGTTLEQLAAAYQFIQRSTELIFTRFDVTSSTNKIDPALEELLAWTKHHLKDIDASEELKIFDRYSGYLSVAVARIIQKLDTTNVSKSVRKTVIKIKEHHSSVVLKQCRLYVEGLSDTVDFWPVLVLLDSLAHPQDDKSFKKKLQKCLQKVVQALLATDGNSLMDVTTTQETRVIAKLWDVLSKHMRTTKSRPLPSFPHASFARRLGQEEIINTLALQAQLATSYPDNTSLVSLVSLAHLSRIEVQSLNSEPAPNDGSKLYLSIAAKIRSLVLNDMDPDAETIKVLGHIAYLQTAPDETSPASLIARLELSRLVLEKHSSVINQHVIDSTLTSIMALASSASKAMVGTEPAGIKSEYIFDRLCTILSTLLVRYRRRLTGRHHLILPVLQNLLRCLFYPPSRKHLTTSSSSKLAYLASLPPWLNPSTHTSTATLPPSSATKFSRVLQQLCNPSASSARNLSKRSSSANDNLVDEVKSLQREVSRHTQYLLQTYCQAMLDGYIASDVKEKLLPGLYAVVNATDVEVMRALNAAMDTSQRAIWKDLYSEWKTYGRWNQR